MSHVMLLHHVLQGGDVAGYDEYVEGVEAEETVSLYTPLKEVRIT